MPDWAVAIIVIAVILVVLIFIAISYKNSFVRLTNQVEEAFATMDVYFKKRWDLVPNLVETIKGITGHETKIFTEITKLRSGIKYDDLSEAEKLDLNKRMAGNISKLLAVAEDYPEITSSQNFLDLNQQLQAIEEDIANARKYFNANVKIYNNKVELIPSCIFAKMFGYAKKDMFSIAEEERQNVKVKF